MNSSSFFTVRDRFEFDFDFVMEFFPVILAACDQTAIKNTE